MLLSDEYMAAQEAEQFFRELKQDKEAMQRGWEHICQTIDTALTDKKIEPLFELIPYMEQGDGYLAYRYIGETRRILRILNILKLEYQYGKTPFCEDCTNINMLLEKYMTVLFALRRLLFCLSAQSEEKAVLFFQITEVSAFSLFVILKEDLIHADEALYQKIEDIYTDIWEKEERELWASLKGMG